MKNLEFIGPGIKYFPVFGISLFMKYPSPSPSKVWIYLYRII